MAEVKKKVGRMACETCGDTVTVKANERGTLSYSCQECDAAPYARAGTIQHGIWSRKMTGTTPETPPAAPAPKQETPTPAAKPAAKSNGTFFG